MIKLYLKYKEEASGETWIENAFSKENVEEIMQGVEGVVNDPEGTGYAHIVTIFCWLEKQGQPS